LTQVQPPVYLILGERDLLFPAETSLANAKKLLSHLKDSAKYPAGHGIETLSAALLYLRSNVATLEGWI